MNFAIIGAGMAGLACADLLKAAGHSLTLFDKGRGPGGRMSTRRLQTSLGEVAIDLGAQYFTARDPAFKRRVTGWSELGLAARWAPAGADAWIGVPGMNAPVRHMASAHRVNWGFLVTGIAREKGAWWLMQEAEKTGPFDAVLSAVPAEQAAAILSLHDFSMARIALLARSQPCWTSMFVFDRPLDDLPTIIRDRSAIAWAARNSAKPGRPETEAWVVQASAAWSGRRLEAPSEQVSEQLLAALSEVMETPLPSPIASDSHRWRYALSAGTGDGALWNRDIGLGVCGDWLLGPRVECAWLSGERLARRCLGSDHRPNVADPAIQTCPKGHVSADQYF